MPRGAVLSTAALCTQHDRKPALFVVIWHRLALSDDCGKRVCTIIKRPARRHHVSLMVMKVSTVQQFKALCMQMLKHAAFLGFEGSHTHDHWGLLSMP